MKASVGLGRASLLLWAAVLATLATTTCSKDPLLLLRLSRTVRVPDDATIEVTLNGKHVDTVGDLGTKLPPGAAVEKGYWIAFTSKDGEAPACPHASGQVCVHLEVRAKNGALLFASEPDQIWTGQTLSWVAGQDTTRDGGGSGGDGGAAAKDGGFDLPTAGTGGAPVDGGGAGHGSGGAAAGTGGDLGTGGGVPGGSGGAAGAAGGAGGAGMLGGRGGGRGGSGGVMTSSGGHGPGGTTGAGGSPATGGSPGTGGSAATGGNPGTGGTGGTMATGGSSTGGVSGVGGGVTSSGGSTGGMVASIGGSSGTGGVGGRGGRGAVGTGGNGGAGVTCVSDALTRCTCNDYCALLSPTGPCPGRGYFPEGDSDCLATCASFMWDEAVLSTLTSGLSCRIHRGYTGNCDWTSPPGGNACESYCTNYCNVMFQNCTGSFAAFSTAAECLSYCSLLAPDPIARLPDEKLTRSGDTYNCRLYWAAQAGRPGAVEQQMIACANAGRMSPACK